METRFAGALILAWYHKAAVAENYGAFNACAQTLYTEGCLISEISIDPRLFFSSTYLLTWSGEIRELTDKLEVEDDCPLAPHMVFSEMPPEYAKVWAATPTVTLPGVWSNHNVRWFTPLSLRSMPRLFDAPSLSLSLTLPLSLLSLSLSCSPFAHFLFALTSFLLP